jgi:hypothetical protein
MSAYFVVRAVVAEADRHDFDVWYSGEHLPDAAKAFRAHYAFYQFADIAAAEAVNASPAISTLVAEFDARWGTRVIRTREVLEVAV